MRLKQFFMPLGIVAALAAGQAWAEQQSITVEVLAQIPTPGGLQVSPVGDWGGRVQQMQWDIATQAPKPIVQQLQVKSGLGEIKAYLSNPAEMVSGGDSVALDVAVAGQKLGVGASNGVVIANPTEAAAGRNVGLNISAVAPSSGTYTSGTYQGTVIMMFESVAPKAL